MENMTIERIFSVSAPVRLRLSNIRGSVSVQPGGGDEISVTAIVIPGSGDFEHTRVQIEQAEDGEVRAETSFGEGYPFWKASEPCKVEYKVRVPAECGLVLNGVSSRIEAAGISGEIQVETVSGNIELAACTGRLKMKSVSGKLRGENLNGPLTLETVSGAVTLETCSFSSLYAHTVSGDLHLETPLSDGSYRINSVSGDVHLLLPEAHLHRVRMKSLSGELVDEMKAHRLSSTAGSSEPAAEIIFDSVSGDLRLSLMAAVAV